MYGESSKPGFSMSGPALGVVDATDEGEEVEVELEVGDDVGEAVDPAIQEQAELTLPTSFLQFLNAVGIAEAAVVVAARNPGQKVWAVAIYRLSTKLR